VRAYPVSQGGGSQGVVISSELQYRLDEKWQLGTFADLGVVKQYVNTYSNWQGLTRANNTYPLGAVGATAKYTLGRWGASAIVAFRVGQNPLYNSSGLHLNADSEYRYVQGWIRASYAF
jgi:hemolysin activation/secretion protein